MIRTKRHVVAHYKWSMIRIGDNYNGYFLLRSLNEPHNEISINVVCVISKGSDQPLYMRSLIRAFACRLNIL